MRHCVISLSDLGAMLYQNVASSGDIPSSQLLLSPSDNVTPLLHFLRAYRLPCNSFLSSIFLASSRKFLSKKQCHCPLSPPLLDHVQASTFSNSSATADADSACNSLHIANLPGPQSIIDRYAPLK